MLLTITALLVSAFAVGASSVTYAATAFALLGWRNTGIASARSTAVTRRLAKPYGGEGRIA